MGRKERIGFAAIAATIAIVAVVVISGGKDDRTERADATPAAAATVESTAPAASATPTPTASPKPEAEVVRYRGGKVVGGRQRLTFEKGETARFSIASDTADEIHVHGYDLKKDVTAGGRVSFSFDADIEGVFEVELEDLGVELAQLRVEP